MKEFAHKTCADAPLAAIEGVAEAGTLVFRVAYNGGGYSGFAEQRDQVTVAGELRRAVETFLRRPVELTCAGRTDAGVHALAQYVSFPAQASELEVGGRRWLRAMDALLPRDISVTQVFHAPVGFSARFDARARGYVYRIVDGPRRPVLTRDHVWWLRMSLDIAAMEKGARHLVGEHDFKSFCKVASAIGKPTCRCVNSVSFARERDLGEDVIAFRIEGNAFLHSMVRTIMGTLVEVGAHRREPAWVADVLAACDRTAAGQTAPADGLTFEYVRYEDDVLVPLEA